jgi:SAM-dependent methyltransferase
MSTVHHPYCPVCGSTSIHPALTVKDHSVSGESFPVWQCGHCSLRFTQDAPDEDSIGKYYQSPDYISHTNTDKGMVNQVYKKARQVTLELKAKLVMNRTKPVGRLLDLGAGIGAFLHAMRVKGWQVEGIEPDETARRQAEKLYGLHLNTSDRFYRLPPGSFDAITLWHVLEHVHQLHPYMEKLKELLQPGGRIFIAVPNYTSADADSYEADWAAYDVPRHLYHFTPASMEILVKKHGFVLEEKLPMWLDSYYISLLSSKYRNGQPSWLGAGINGSLSNLKTIFNKDRSSSIIYILKKA